MKKVLILIISLSLSICFAQAQIRPDYLSVSKGQFYDESGTLISSRQLQQIIGDQIFNETYVGASKQYNAGRKLILWGAIGTGVGLVTGIGIGALGYALDNEGLIAAGVYGGALMASLGSAALSAGIPLTIIGKNRLSWIADDYNDSQTNVTLNITGSSSGPGLGLALVF